MVWKPAVGFISGFDWLSYRLRICLAFGFSDIKA